MIVDLEVGEALTITTPRGIVTLNWTDEGADLLISVGSDLDTTVPQVTERIGQAYEGVEVDTKRVCDVWLFHPQSELIQS